MVETSVLERACDGKFLLPVVQAGERGGGGVRMLPAVGGSVTGLRAEGFKQWREGDGGVEVVGEPTQVRLDFRREARVKRVRAARRKATRERAMQEA